MWIDNPGPMGRGFRDSRDHVYGVVDRHNIPYFGGGCGGEILGFMCIGEV